MKKEVETRGADQVQADQVQADQVQADQVRADQVQAARVVSLTVVSYLVMDQRPTNCEAYIRAKQSSSSHQYEAHSPLTTHVTLC